MASNTEALKIALDALQFYAKQEHFILHNPSAWDTVSGEPANYQEDESNTATVEDGSVAKQAIDEIAALEQPSTASMPAEQEPVAPLPPNQITLDDK